MDFYGTAAGFTTYHTARGRDVSAYTTGEIEISLLVASEWIDGSFRHMWGGEKVGYRDDQVRDWPRSYVYDSDGFLVDPATVPTEIEQATYEATLRHLTDPTVLSPDYTPTRYKRVAVEGAINVEYRNLDASSAQQQFLVIGNILSRLLGGSGNSSLSGKRIPS